MHAAAARIAAAAVLLLSLFAARTARADRELIVPFHEGGRFVIDQLSGLRLSAASGFSYAGPAGVAFRSSRADAVTPGAPGAETKTTTLWLAPSVDVFVTEHLSIGGLVEIAHTFGTTEVGGQELELPGTTSMTFLPRVGFFAPIGDRWGIWPRAGFGYTSAQTSSFPAAGGTPTRETFRAMLLDVDLTLVYRFDETFFLRMGPEVGVTLGGRREEQTGGQSAAADASVVQVSGVVGFGVNLEL